MKIVRGDCLAKTVKTGAASLVRTRAAIAMPSPTPRASKMQHDSWVGTAETVHRQIQGDPSGRGPGFGILKVRALHSCQTLLGLMEIPQKEQGNWAR